MPYIQQSWFISSVDTEYVDGLVQERRNSITNALELRLSCANPSMCPLSDEMNRNCCMYDMPVRLR